MDQLLAMRVFARIVEAGSFSRAADALAVPRPTATKLIQDLETHVGALLLQRTTRRVSVTTEGAAYYERAVRVLGEVEEMNSLVADARAQPKGRLRVDIGSSLANWVLLPALHDFRRRYPDIDLEVGVSDRPVDLVGEGVDCVIRGGEMTDSGLIARRIADLDWITCASPGYLERAGTPAHPLELEGRHAMASYFSSLTGRPFPLLFESAGERHELRLRNVVSVNDSTAHLGSLLFGLGIGQTFAFMAAPHVASGALVPLLTGWTRPRHALQVVYPSTRHLNAKLRVFVDWIVELFAKIDDRPDGASKPQ